MSLKRNLILKLLDAHGIDDFEESVVFRTQIRGDSESVEILLDFLAHASEDRRTRARTMLSTLEEESVEDIAKGLSKPGARWRFSVLEILSTVVGTSDDPSSLLSSLAEPLVGLFNDVSPVEYAFENPVEIEYQSRVCDEAYLFYMGLADPDHDDSSFLSLSEGDRNREIKTLGGRIDNDTLLG